LASTFPGGIDAGFKGHSLLAVSEMLTERGELFRIAERTEIQFADDAAA
jgi:hypothetical protein